MFSRRIGRCIVFLVMVAAMCAAADSTAPEPSQQIYLEVPEVIDPEARYLFYLHGGIVEDYGTRPKHPEYGVYEYGKILEVFAKRGFVVISERRPSGTDEEVYASEVAEQVRALIEGGVPPERITVVGFSKGGGIAMIAASLLADDAMNFVFVGACGNWILTDPEIVPRGRLLVLREASDRVVRSCDNLFARIPDSAQSNEIVLELGGGHGAFYRPRPAWVNPIVDWAGASE